MSGKVFDLFSARLGGPLSRSDFPTAADPRLWPSVDEQEHGLDIESGQDEEDRARQATTLRAPVLVTDDSDVRTLAQVVASVYFRLQASRWLIPSEIDRWRIYPPFFEAAYLRPALKAGALWCSQDRNSVAAWLPMPAGEPAVDPDADAQILRITGAYSAWFDEFDRLLDEAHPKHTAHSFLGVAATNTFAQKEGYIRGLVQAHLAELDREGVPAYLEAVEEPLVRVWERFGFETIDRVIRLPATGGRRAVRMYPMWRER